MTTKWWFLHVSDPKDHNFDRIFNLINDRNLFAKMDSKICVLQQINARWVASIWRYHILWYIPGLDHLDSWCEWHEYTCCPRGWRLVSCNQTHHYVPSLLDLRAIGQYRLSKHVRIAACVTVSWAGSYCSVWQEVANGIRQVDLSVRTRLLRTCLTVRMMGLPWTTGVLWTTDAPRTAGKLQTTDAPRTTGVLRTTNAPRTLPKHWFKKF